MPLVFVHGRVYTRVRPRKHINNMACYTLRCYTRENSNREIRSESVAMSELFSRVKSNQIWWLPGMETHNFHPNITAQKISLSKWETRSSQVGQNLIFGRDGNIGYPTTSIFANPSKIFHYLLKLLWILSRFIYRAWKSVLISYGPFSKY